MPGNVQLFPKAWGALCGTASLTAPASTWPGLGGVKILHRTSLLLPFTLSSPFRYRGFALIDLTGSCSALTKMNLYQKSTRKRRAFGTVSLHCFTTRARSQTSQAGFSLGHSTTASITETHQAVPSESSGKKQDHVQGMCSSTRVLHLTSSVD